MTLPDFENFAKIIAALLNADLSRISPATTANDVDGWDSVRHANVILSIEDTFGIMFTDDEVMNTPDVGTLHQRLLAHLAAR